MPDGQTFPSFNGRRLSLTEKDRPLAVLDDYMNYALQGCHTGLAPSRGCRL
jgi:hypothetical protein